MPSPSVANSRFFAGIPWSAVEDLNAFLCQKGGYQSGRTSDGYEEARALWPDQCESSMSLVSAAHLCRQCHRLAPFLFLNRNTFANIAKISLEPAFAGFPAEMIIASRAAIGHFVAGTIGEDEMLAILPEAQ